MWPFRKKITKFEFEPKTLRAEIKAAKDARLAMGVEPDSANWDVILDLGKYFDSVVALHLAYTNQSDEVVVAVRKLVTDGESEMDFDTVTVGVGMLASIAFPPIPGENEELYNHRVCQHYAIYKATQANYQGNT